MTTPSTPAKSPVLSEAGQKDALVQALLYALPLLEFVAEDECEVGEECDADQEVMDCARHCQEAGCVALKLKLARAALGAAGITP
jgi:predicted amidohydrolase